MQLADMNDGDLDIMPFDDLVTRYGASHADLILKSLERFEGIREDYVKNLSPDERMRNVFQLMTENMAFQTRH